jgi:hypothetical protein
VRTMLKHGAAGSLGPCGTTRRSTAAQPLIEEDGQATTAARSGTARRTARIGGESSAHRRAIVMAPTGEALGKMVLRNPQCWVALRFADATHQKEIV